MARYHIKTSGYLETWFYVYLLIDLWTLTFSSMKILLAPVNQGVIFINLNSFYCLWQKNDSIHYYLWQQFGGTGQLFIDWVVGHDFLPALVRGLWFFPAWFGGGGMFSFFGLGWIGVILLIFLFRNRLCFEWIDILLVHW